MKQKIILLTIGLFSLFLFVLYGGIGFDREWNDSTIFMKHKPTLKLFFESKVGESDKTGGDDEKIYVEYFEKNRMPGLYLNIVLLFLQTGIVFLVLFSYLSIFKIKDPFIFKKELSLLILYCIFINFFVYLFAWNFRGLESKFSYIILFMVFVLVDVGLFSMQLNNLIGLYEEE